MGIEKYLDQLNEVENKFYDYKKNLEKVIEQVASAIVRTVITKGVIANPTLYY